jgi:hypothetical protein
VAPLHADDCQATYDRAKKYAEEAVASSIRLLNKDLLDRRLGPGAYDKEMAVINKRKNEALDDARREYNGCVAAAKTRKLAPTNDLAILMHIADSATRLRQADVAGEAIAAMLRINPSLKDDPDILALQAALKTPASATTAPASPPPAPPAWKNSARPTKTSSTAPRPSSATPPETTEAWLLRAVAAMGTERARDGWEAGKKILALGALDSTDPRLRSALVQLNSRKWLDQDPLFAFPQPGKPWENSLGMKFVPVPVG